MTLFVKCCLGFSSRLGDTSHFAFTSAYTRSFWLLEGVSTVGLYIFSSENHVRLILPLVIRFFRRLHALSIASICLLSATELHGVVSSKSFLAILTTEECAIPVSLAISCGLLLVPGFPSWLQIKSLTKLIFESILTERRRPLSALPIESILFTRSYNVCRFHCLAGNSAIILPTVQPFSIRKH